MKHRKYFSICALLMLSALLAVIPATSYAQETMSNEDVISLAKAGLANAVIVGKIRTSRTNFGLSTDALIKLKQSGVGDDVVAAMLAAKSGPPVSPAPNGAAAANAAATGDINDPMAKHNFGIYLYEEKGGARKMTRLRQSAPAKIKDSAGVTRFVPLANLASKSKMRTILQGRHAPMQLDTTSPVFYFYLDIASGGFDTDVPSDPKEFILVRFKQGKDKRELQVGESGFASSSVGVSDKNTIEFNIEDLGNGIFRCTPPELSDGEYSFALIKTLDAEKPDVKFFDFGIK